jgi:hypothetical protein
VHLALIVSSFAELHQLLTSQSTQPPLDPHAHAAVFFVVPSVELHQSGSSAKHLLPFALVARHSLLATHMSGSSVAAAASSPHKHWEPFGSMPSVFVHHSFWTQRAAGVTSAAVASHQLFAVQVKTPTPAVPVPQWHL